MNAKQEALAKATRIALEVFNPERLEEIEQNAESKSDLRRRLASECASMRKRAETRAAKKKGTPYADAAQHLVDAIDSIIQEMDLNDL